MWTAALLILLGLWIFLQATVGDLGGRLLSWARS